MTVAEWLVSIQPDDLIAAARAERCWNNRKSRLFACGCYRHVWDRIGCQTIRTVVEQTEARADRTISQAALTQSVPMWAGSVPGTTDFSLEVSLRSLVAEKCNSGYVAFQIQRTFDSMDGHAQLLEVQSALIRDIVGNPYRPVTFSPDWRTGTAVALARTMYESRDFSGMPILADALQDAGCDSDDILGHCRATPQVHVRGCWVVDLVLGKA